MNHRLPGGQECGGAGDPCSEPGCPFRPQLPDLRLAEAEDPGSCELVVWRDGSCRSELWMIDGKAFLRLYETDTLVLQEPAERGRAYYRAQELRRLAAP